MPQYDSGNVQQHIKPDNIKVQPQQKPVNSVYDGFNTTYRFSGRVKWNQSLRSAAAEFIAGDVMQKLKSNNKDLYDCLVEKAKSELMERGF